MVWLLVFAFGGLGALARVGVSALFSVQRLPWGTLLVNVVGCLLIGVAFQVFSARPQLAFPWRLALVGGFLGGFTTFSAFGLETFELLLAGRPAAATAYALGSVALGLAAVVLGQAMARQLS